jgi:hypothetical protein
MTPVTLKMLMVLDKKCSGTVFLIVTDTQFDSQTPHYIEHLSHRNTSRLWRVPNYVECTVDRKGLGRTVVQSECPRLLFFGLLQAAR